MLGPGFVSWRKRDERLRPAFDHLTLLSALGILRSMSAIVSPSLSTVRDPPALDLSHICGVFVWCGWMRKRYLADKSVIVSVPVDEANTKATSNDLSKDT